MDFMSDKEELLLKVKERLRTTYRYLEESPTGLVRWVQNREQYVPVGTKRIRRDAPESWVTSVFGVNFIVHRIIWELVYGEIPEGMVIDHIDGNPLNNRLSNLRVVTLSLNQRNQKRTKLNKSGKTGVSFRVLRGTGYWRVKWVVERGKTREKSFSTKKYPNAYELACEYRDKKIEELNSNGYGYSDRHGTVALL